jgi:hypothetical protein
MSVSQIFGQGGGHGCGGGCDYGCYDWDCDGKYRRTGYYYRRYDNDYYSYNDGCGYYGHSRGFLGIFS